MKQNIKTGMSLALATALSLGVSACSSSDDAGVTPASTGTDVTVERGKVYDANVTDSSNPAQVATEKSAQNVYTFANAPTYPVVVNGGWIDVNDDGKMDTSDVKLDIEMKSYGTTVTPITTVMATESNATKREAMLQELADKLNATGTGSDTKVTVADLLKVPSDAPRDVMVVANATYKEMKDNVGVSVPDLDNVMAQFTAINSAIGSEGTAVAAEKLVISDLGDKIEKVSNQDIFEFEQDKSNAVIPELVLSLLKNNITGFDPHTLTFKDDYTVSSEFGIRTWRVDGKTLIINGADGDRQEYTFDSTNPTNDSNVSVVGYYGDSVENYVLPITVTAPVVVTPPTTGGGDITGGSTTPDLSGYSSIVIYKNILQTTADGLLAGFSAQKGFKSENISASCTDFGFTVKPAESLVAGATIKIYTEINTKTYAVRSCTENDYTSASFGGGSANILAYYGN